MGPFGGRVERPIAGPVAVNFTRRDNKSVKKAEKDVESARVDLVFQTQHDSIRY